MRWRAAAPAWPPSAAFQRAISRASGSPSCRPRPRFAKCVRLGGLRCFVAAAGAAVRGCPAGNLGHAAAASPGPSCAAVPARAAVRAQSSLAFRCRCRLLPGWRQPGVLASTSSMSIHLALPCCAAGAGGQRLPVRRFPDREPGGRVHFQGAECPAVALLHARWHPPKLRRVRGHTIACGVSAHSIRGRAGCMMLAIYSHLQLGLLRRPPHCRWHKVLPAAFMQTGAAAHLPLPSTHVPHTCFVGLGPALIPPTRWAPFQTCDDRERYHGLFEVPGGQPVWSFCCCGWCSAQGQCVLAASPASMKCPYRQTAASAGWRCVLFAHSSAAASDGS